MPQADGVDQQQIAIFRQITQQRSRLGERLDVPAGRLQTSKPADFQFYR